MICKHIELSMETTEPRDVAKAMLKFWQYQLEEARQDHSIAANKADACRMANMQARDEWERDCEFTGGFSGPRLPWTECQIKAFEDKVPEAEKRLKEARAMAGYIINFITDRAHPGEGYKTSPGPGSEEQGMGPGERFDPFS